MPFCFARLHPVNAGLEDPKLLFALHIHDIMPRDGLVDAVLFGSVAPCECSSEDP